MTLPGPVEREHRLQRLALEGQLAVGVVLEDPEVVLGGELDQALPLLGRERAAGRVVGVGDDVGELDRALGQRRLERADVEPVGLQRDRHQLDAELLQEQQRAVVGRLLDRRPGRRARAGAANSIAPPSSEPLVTITCEASSPPWRSAIHSQSPGWPIPVP